MTDNEDSPQYEWSFFQEKPPQAFIHYYESIENVPEKHRKEAQRRALRANSDVARDFLSVGKTVPRKISQGVKDAIAIGTLEGLASQIKGDRKEILKLLPESEGPPIQIPPGELGYKLFQIHVVTVSYTEAAGDILLRHHVSTGQEWAPTDLIQWAAHKDRIGASLTESGDLDEQLSIVHEWATKKVSRLILALLQADIIDGPTYQQMDAVRERRNDFIHSAHTLAVNDFGDNQDIRDAIDECESSVSVLGEKLEDVPRNPVYDSLVD
jgi:hypothetical protein